MTVHHIENLSDWETLSREGFNIVIDPMIVRCGELFLKGGRSAKKPKQTWSLLERNVHALALFFDTLILEDRIPVFDYGETFESSESSESSYSQDLDQQVFAAINNSEHIFYGVKVGGLLYSEVKAEALVELRKLYSGPQRIEQQLAEDIVSEMSAAEYKWTPGLGELKNELTSDLEKNLARFFLGGLIFGAYAQLLGGEHVIQPKRSRLFLAASLNKPSDYRFEEELFGELKRRARSSVTELPWRPTFFPYLLSVADAPEALLDHALKLRQSSEVREYRNWMQSAIAQWRRDGHLGPVKKEVRTIADAIDRKIDWALTLPKVEIKVEIADVVALSADIDMTQTLASLWGWFFTNLPGRQYRKLLIRAIMNDHAYVEIEKRIKSVWMGNG